MPAPAKELPDRSLLCEFVSYDPQTGNFFWVHRPRKYFKSEKSWKSFNSLRAGTKAGYLEKRPNGKPSAVTILFSINGKIGVYKAHRLAYVLMGVEIPTGMEVDHRNRNPWDNRWSNLRLCTRSQNTMNTTLTSRKLPKGVCLNMGKYSAVIRINGEKKYLGRFDTPEEAGKVYHDAAMKHHGEFALTTFTHSRE